MRPLAKVGVVVGGYLAAFLLASAAVALSVAVTSGPVGQASSGMLAFSDTLLFLAVFGVVAVVPTGAALFFLRPYRRVWILLAAVGLAIAVTGISAAGVFAVGRNDAHSTLATWADYSVLRILVAPILALLFLVCAVFSPHGFPRLSFLAATVIELAVCAFGGLVWVAPLLFQAW